MKEKYGVTSACFRQGSYQEELQYEYVEIWSASYPTQLQIQVAINEIYPFYSRFVVKDIKQLTNNFQNQQTIQSQNNNLNRHISQLQEKIEEQEDEIMELQDKIETLEIQLQVQEEWRKEYYAEAIHLLTMFIYENDLTPPDLQHLEPK